MHYTLTVALPADTEPDKLRAALDDAMAPFDEQLDVAPYVTKTRAEVLAEIHAAASKDNDWAHGYAAKIAGKSDDEIIRDWDGTDEFDQDGNPMSTRNPHGQWDWWVIGGRWGGQWTLRPGAESGLRTENHAFGRADKADNNQHTDCARLQDIEPESLRGYSYLTLEGEWHTRWIWPGPDGHGYEVPEDEFAAKYLRWIATLPRNTWLVNVDYHS